MKPPIRYKPKKHRGYRPDRSPNVIYKPRNRSRKIKPLPPSSVRDTKTFVHSPTRATPERSFYKRKSPYTVDIGFFILLLVLLILTAGAVWLFIVLI